MNYLHMTGDEVLRLADPKTDLEVKLLSLAEEYRGEAEYCKGEMRACGPSECDECENRADYLDQIDELEEEIEQKDKEIEELKEIIAD